MQRDMDGVGMNMVQAARMVQLDAFDASSTTRFAGKPF